MRSIPVDLDKGTKRGCIIEMNIVVTDIRYKMALAPLWSLSQAGYQVVCGETEGIPREKCLGFYSKYCKETLRWPREEEPALAIAQASPPGSVVLPVGRETLRSFSRSKGWEDRVHALVSSPAVLDRADDKAQVQRLAAALGIPTPRTYARRPEERAEDLSHRLAYPVILKYRDGEALGLKSWERYRIARDPGQFQAYYSAMAQVQADPVIQDYLSGQDVGLAMVMDGQSRPVDFFCYVSQREYPLSGGPTCLCRTVFNRSLVEYGARLLGELGFRGLAMLDFKGTPDQPCLLEVNPRLWGSACLATAAGSTLYESWVKAALGQAEPLDLAACQPRYRVGQRMKVFPHCVLAAGKSLAKGRVGAFCRDMKMILNPAVPQDGMLLGDKGPGRRHLRNLLGGSR